MNMNFKMLMDVHSLNYNALGHTRSSKRVSLHGSHGVTLVIFLTRPSLITSVGRELATTLESCRLTKKVLKNTLKEVNKIR